MSAESPAVVSGPEPRLVILVNSGVTMSRGKYAAQAIHAALMALGVHPGCPVVVLGANRSEIEASCTIQVHDAGVTELEPGTLTAGASEVPEGRGDRRSAGESAAVDPVDVEDLSRLLYGFDKPHGTDWWASAALLDPNGARVVHAKAHAVLALFGDRLLPREEK